jgi:hypothetical protein
MASTRVRRPNPTTASTAAPAPVMRVTRYDRVSSFMMALILAILVGVAGIVAHWFNVRRAPPLELIPLEMIEIGGGYEDGNLNDTLQVESPEPLDPRASPIEEELEEQQLLETIESVVTLSDRAATQVQQALAGDSHSGVTGSSVGAGGRPLGSGGGPGSGIPAWQRWYIRFNESSPTEYARQLDHFRIELGVYFPATGQLTYVKNFSAATPTVTPVEQWKEERIYFKWSGGAREQLDRELLLRAGVNVAGGQIYQFYPDEAVRLLGTLEHNYAKRPAKEIQRTYFSVVPQAGGFTFAVTRQTYLR